MRKSIYAYVEYLIINEGIKDILFGSRSAFGDFCHSIVNELRAKYPEIKRVAYACRYEGPVSEKDRERLISAILSVTNRKVDLLRVLINA